MVGLEGARGCSAGDLLHHRRFHFEIAAVVEKLAQGLQRFRALYKNFAAFEVGEEVHIALAVAELDVGQAVEFFGQGQHGFGEEGEALDVDGELAGACAEEIAADADVVAEVEKFIEREALLADGVEADVDLEALAVLLQGGEAGLALGANGHDAARDGYGYAVGFESFGSCYSPLGAHLGDGVHLLSIRGGEAVGIGRLAQLLDLY